MQFIMDQNVVMLCMTVLAKKKKTQVDIFTENYSDCENLEYILSSSNSKLQKSSNLIQDLITYCVTKDAPI